jgi:hypothetical protein
VHLWAANGLEGTSRKVESSLSHHNNIVQLIRNKNPEPQCLRVEKFLQNNFLIESTAGLKVVKHFMIFCFEHNLILQFLIQFELTSSKKKVKTQKLFSFSRLRPNAEGRKSAGASSCEARRKCKFNLPI